MFFPKNEIVKHLNLLSSDESFQNVVGNIKAGKFRRVSENYDYQCRLLYTKELRRYVYNPMMLNEIFSDLELKTLFFRTFGYKGQMNFTIYPNAWLRDLPLLDLEEGVYLGDGILLGTNQVTTNQKFITVGHVRVGANTVIDQRGAIGYSSTVGKDCVLGFDVSIGIKASIGDQVYIGAKTAIGHGVTIGNNVKIGQCCIIGDMCIIEDGVTLELAKCVPQNTIATKDGIVSRRSPVLQTA